MGLFIAIVIVFGVMAIAAWRINRKDAARQALMETPLPLRWRKILEEDVRLYNRVPEELREKLDGMIQVFLAEKRFEGCGGQEITDEVRVTVAGLACILLLGHHRGVYPKLETILVYPGAYVGRDKKRLEGGTVVEGDVRAGESWTRGPVVLAWEDAWAEARGEDRGHNVILHEFAHQLDQEDGFADGQPPDADEDAEWQEVLAEEFEDAEESYEEEPLDEYGQESMAEAFAVATEAFFETAKQLERKHPRLYEKLRKYYGLDPAQW
jgi:Mlc titration factor MtfA (ptsG expression regulator)